MKQVDIILSSSINHIGGPVGTLKRILKNKDYFESRGYAISVFTFESIALGPFNSIDNLPVTPIPSSKQIRRMKVSSFVRKILLKSGHLSCLIIWKKYRKTKELVNYYVSLDRNPDIVQCHSHYDGSHYLSMRMNDRPMSVVFLHSNGIPYDQELTSIPKLAKTRYFKKLKEQCDWMINNANLLAFIANISQRNFLECYPNRSLLDTVVIKNGIDDLSIEQRVEYEKLKKENKGRNFKYRLCCVGTVSYRKGQRLIIETMHLLSAEVLKELHVDFIGDGPERPKLESLVVNYALEDNVRFCGSVPNVDVYKYLAQNNIYILMSRNEGLPISVLEAMRVAMPIIGTNVAGIPECINNGYNGFLLNYDKDELASLLQKLSDYDWVQMGRNSRIKFENEFTFDRMKKEFCDMYDKMLKV